MPEHLKKFNMQGVDPKRRATFNIPDKVKVVIGSPQLRHAAEIPQIYAEICRRHNVLQQPREYDPKTDGELDENGYTENSRHKKKVLNGYVVGERYEYRRHGELNEDGYGKYILMVNGEPYKKGKHGEMYEGIKGKYVTVNGKNTPLVKRRVMLLPMEEYNPLNYDSEEGEYAIKGNKRYKIESRVSIVNGQRSTKRYVMGLHVLDKNIPDVHILTQRFMAKSKSPNEKRGLLKDVYRSITAKGQFHPAFKEKIKGKISYEQSPFGPWHLSIPDAMPNLDASNRNAPLYFGYGKGYGETLDPNLLGTMVDDSMIVSHTLIARSRGAGVNNEAAKITPDHGLVSLVKSIFGI